MDGGGLDERESVARGLLDAFVAPAFTANGYVAVVAADFDLVAFFYEVAVGVDASVDDSFTAAGASGFYFVDGVGDFEESPGAFEEVGFEVGAKAVAYDVGAEVVDDARELVDLFGGKELCFVDKEPIDNRHGFFEQVVGKGVEIGVVVDPFAFTLYADTGFDDVVFVAGVDDGFHADVLHVSFFEVVGSGK